MDLTKNAVFSSVLQKALQDTIVTFDEEGIIISVNPSVKRMFGYVEEELIGASIEVLLHSVESETSGETPITFEMMVPKLIGRMIEAKAKRKNHIIFPVDIYIGDAMVEDYQLFICTIRDISERKEVELLRKQQLDRLEHAVEERTLELLSMNHQLHRKEKKNLK